MKTETKKTNTKTARANAALGLALILAVVLGCGISKRRQSVQSNQPILISKELRVSGTVTSANTGGMCAKKINGEIVRSSQVGFSYSVDGKSYTSVGCTYNPLTAVGAKISVCYNSSAPAGAKPCTD
jgi:hypothetical protein